MFSASLGYNFWTVWVSAFSKGFWFRYLKKKEAKKNQMCDPMIFDFLYSIYALLVDKT